MSDLHAAYLHIPFCRHICTYCAFNTYAGLDDLIPAYVEALCVEIAYVGERQPGTTVHTVFWGGGTPSMIPAGLIAQAHEALRRSFVVMADAEITLEANPNDLTASYARELFSAGVNRLSIGVQSANERELRLYEREHDHAMTIAAVENARAAGFANLSLDLIFGNPDQTMDEWQATLTAALALTPQHISLYGLEVKGGTELKRRVARGDVTIPSDDAAADMYEMARVVLAEAGFRHYEISNWALPGFESRHNQQYWHNRPYFGFGAGAHGYVAGQRTIVVRSPQRYVALAGSASQRAFPRSPATSKCVPVSVEDEISETIMLGLRLVQDGINRRAFVERFGVDIVALRRAEVQRLVDLGLLEVSDESVRLTPAAYLISNRVIAELA
jgi:oxygen-independent coproporphyrinogen-3 oxidase